VSELFDAAGRGDVARVRSILDRRPDLVNERGEMPGSYGKRTALHYGVAHAGIVELLLERGADPNIRDDGDHAMPLHVAAENLPRCHQLRAAGHASS
jgi:ankyrin repeat protein